MGSRFRVADIHQDSSLGERGDLDGQEPPSVLNIVCHRQTARLAVQPALARLRADDRTPPLPRRSSTIELINRLRGALRRAPTFDAAISQLRASPFFAPFVAEQTNSVVRFRNDMPCDCAIVYRHQLGDCDIESWQGASRDDPVGLLVTGRWLQSATSKRRANTLQRYVFGLHDLGSDDAFGLPAYRAICGDARVSWQAIVLHRDKVHTWVLFVWFRVHEPTRLRVVSQVMRAGLANLASLLGQIFVAQIAKLEPASEARPGAARGMLAFDREFGLLRRQDFRAELLLQGLAWPGTPPVHRSTFYTRVRLELQRLEARGLPLRWRTDSFGHPVSSRSRAAVEISVQTCEKPISGAPEQIVHLRELHLPAQSAPASWRLADHRPTGLATSLKKLGQAHREQLSSMLPDGYFIRSARCVARPVWDVDMLFDRIRRYRRVDATELCRRGAHAVDFERHPMHALLFRGDIVGVLHAV